MDTAANRHPALRAIALLIAGAATAITAVAAVHSASAAPAPAARHALADNGVVNSRN
jgi:hypothetical protein